MYQKYLNLPRRNVNVDAGSVHGPLELWRHTLGHGGINADPLPEKVVKGVSKLKPRLIRIFLQEFFFIYRGHGQFDWTRLDAYMDAFSRTGANIVAAIAIKPKTLFPEIDQSVWMPNSVEEWQKVIYELVKRYSVEKPIVTYWEVGNETDIGEWGGCPYLIKDPHNYFEYYKMTIKPILDAFPSAKVGGTANASARNQPLPGFIELCRKHGTQLDFISWHVYSDDPEQHKSLIEHHKSLLSDYPGKRPEMLVTEVNKDFDPVSIEDIAFEPRRAAAIASIIMSMMEAGLDWSFYYHLWDQVCYRDDFEKFFADPYIMVKHWNEVPHRFGLFGVNGEVRPQYFVYQMLGRLGEEKVDASADDTDIKVLAGRNEGSISILAANYNLQASRDIMLTVHFSNLEPGLKNLKAYRIDSARRWCEETLELELLEQRRVDAQSGYHCQFYCPADCVLMVTLEDSSAI